MLVVSPKFRGMKLIQQHRLMNKVRMTHRIHGRSFRTSFPSSMALPSSAWLRSSTRRWMISNLDYRFLLCLFGDGGNCASISSVTFIRFTYSYSILHSPLFTELSLFWPWSADQWSLTNHCACTVWCETPTLGSSRSMKMDSHWTSSLSHPFNKQEYCVTSV